MVDLSDKYVEFEKYISEVADKLKNGFFGRKVKLVSHFDADGIASASIIIKMLERMNVEYDFFTVQQLNERFLFDLRNESGYNYIFSDVGSGQLDELVSHFENKSSELLVLDHHRINEAFDNDSLEKSGIYHVNCHMFGLDGATEISGSGVCYFFARNIDEKNKDLAPLAIVGAIGDVQAKNEFQPLNKKILDEAINNGFIEVRNELNFFGIQTKSIGRLIESGSNIDIPSISGNRMRVSAFLNSVNIDFNKRYYELTSTEKKKLAEKIIEFRKDYFFKNPENIYSEEYLLVGEKEGTVFRDLREYSTLLNSCGRLGKSEWGVGSCLGDNELREKALENLREYKSEIVNALNWYDENKDKKTYVLSGKRYSIVNAQDHVSPNIVGTLASILSKSRMVGLKKYVLTMGRNKDNTTKISLRYSGKKPDLNIRDIINKITEKTGGESGGHDFAAGAIIEQDKESDFIAFFIKSVND